MMTWIRKKYYENKVMLVLYKTITELLDEQKELFSLLTRLNSALKEISTVELEHKLIAELEKIVHDSAEKERNEKS